MSSDTEAKDPSVQDSTKHSSPNPTVDESFFTDGGNPKRGLPQSLDHFNAKDLKILFKSSLAVWIMTILIFINPTSDAIGQAAFFGCIVLFIMPPSGVVLIHVLAGVTIIVGLALGWAWGTITMKAALATRPASDLSSRYAELQQAIAQNTITASGQTPALQVAIYEGFMLDTRVTLTYFCMMGLFIYLVSRIRVAAPKLTLIGIFAMVVADIYLANAPLIPTFQGTIPKTLIVPTAVAVGIGLVCNILIFPRSTSSIILDTMGTILAPMPAFFNALDRHFREPNRRFDVKRLDRLAMDLNLAYKSVDSSIKFLPMDFSYGRWSPSHIGSLHQPLRQVLIAFEDLLQLPLSREQSKMKEAALLEATKGSLNEGSSTLRFPIAHHQIAKALAMRDYVNHPEMETLLAKTFGLLSSCSEPLFQAWLGTVVVVEETLKHQSSRKAKMDPEKIQANLDSLKKLADNFESSAAEQLLQPHSHLFDASGNLIRSDEHKHSAPLLAFMLGLQYQERIINFSQALIELLQYVLKLEQKRQKKRVWIPTGLSKLFSWGVSDDNVPSTVEGALDLRRVTTAASTHGGHGRDHARKLETLSEAPDPDNFDAKTHLANMRISHGRQRSIASNILLTVINWFTNDEGLHAARTLIITIALALPAVITSSAGFYYREKGLWALIMGQMALTPYTSDFISGLLVRVVATVLGGILGLVCWYIGAGSGPGNPYGMAAIMGVAIVALMWWRLFGPPEQMQVGIVMSATIYLVVAYSWTDAHNPTYGNPGVGYNIFWRRLLLVLLGFAASTIVMFIPRPPSGSRHYRELLSGQLSSIKDRYSLFISTWRTQPADLIEVIENEVILSKEILESSIRPIELLRFEFSSSNINSATLLKVCDLCIDLNSHITQLIIYTKRLTPQLRQRFLQITGANHETAVADLMAVITLLERSLVTGRPLPAVLPTPLLGRLFSARNTYQSQESKEGGVMEELTARQLLTGEGGRHWASALGAYISLLMKVDEIMILLKRTLGEESAVDFDSLAV